MAKTRRKEGREGKRKEERMEGERKLVVYILIAHSSSSPQSFHDYTFGR